MSPTSLFVSVLVVVVLSMHIAYCGLVDDQACANNVHKQCKCDIDFEVIEDKKTKEKMCHKLQSCAHCMAVPRCQSIYLDQFRSLLRTTIVITKLLTSTCPKINYKNFLAGAQKACNKEGRVYDKCGQWCYCQNGVYVDCIRQRKEFTQMSFEERIRFVNTYYKATTNRFLKDDFQKILKTHSEIPTDYLHHMPNIFFPWHRWFLLKTENFLRQIDCRVTIPYFQWTAPGKNLWRTTNPKDVWSGGPQGLGGNGVPPSYCVQDGKFRKGKWSLPVTKGGGCLRRNFRKNCVLFNEKQLHKLLRSKSFRKFESTVREELHSKFHDCIGGDMPDNEKAGNTPEVLLHHSFMDKIWDQWQRKGSHFKYEYFTTINAKMPFADIYPWQILDNNNLPGNVALGYKAFKEKKTGKSKDTQEESEEEDFWGDENVTDEGDVTDEEDAIDEEDKGLRKK